MQVCSAPNPMQGPLDHAAPLQGPAKKTAYEDGPEVLTYHHPRVGLIVSFYKGNMTTLQKFWKVARKNMFCLKHNHCIYYFDVF